MHHEFYTLQCIRHGSSHRIRPTGLPQAPHKIGPFWCRRFLVHPVAQLFVIQTATYNKLTMTTTSKKGTTRAASHANRSSSNNNVNFNNHRNNDRMTPLARRTLRDHYFTGSAVHDFGMDLISNSLEIILCSERLEELMPFPTEPSETLSDRDGDQFDDVESRVSLDTDLETVKMSNLEPTPPPGSHASATDGSSTASELNSELGDCSGKDILACRNAQRKYGGGDSRRNSKSTILSFRLWAFVGLFFIGMSMSGTVIFWLIAHRNVQDGANKNNGSGLDRSGNNMHFQGTIRDVPTASPVVTTNHGKKNSNKSPTDLFQDTGEPSVVKCPPPLYDEPRSLAGKKGVASHVDMNGRVNLARLFAIDPYWNYVYPSSKDHINEKIASSNQGAESTPTRTSSFLVPPRNQPSLIQYVPLLDARVVSDEALDWKITVHRNVDVEEGNGSDINQGISTRPKHVLGFYQPDAALLADFKDDNKSPPLMSVEEALDQWTRLEQALSENGTKGNGKNKKPTTLVSPTTIRPKGAWMRQFMHQVEARCLRVDWIGIRMHVKAHELSVAEFKTKLGQIYSFYGGTRPLLLTELAIVNDDNNVTDSTASEAQILRFVQHVLPWLEGQSWIAGYAWSSKPIASTATSAAISPSTKSWSEMTEQHQASSSSDTVAAASLFDETTGQLTALGRYYASVRHDNPQGDQSISI